MAFFQGGTTYQPGGQVTATNLNALINSATPLNHNRNHFATDSKIVTVVAGKVSGPAAGELCWDTSAGGLFVYDGTNWVGIAPQALRVYTAQSSISSGDVVVLDAANASSVKTGTNAAGLDYVVGIARNAATTGQSVLVQHAEIGPVNCTSGAVSIGSYLAKSATAGKAEATTAGNAFAIALTSKSGGAEGTVSALLGVRTPGQVTASFSTYSLTSASLTASTWYDIPNAALGAAVTTDGTSRLKLNINTSRANQPVTFCAKSVKLLTPTVAHRIAGIRVVLGTNTVIDTASTKGSLTPPDFIPDSSLEDEFIGLNTVIYQKASSYEMLTRGLTVHFLVPSAGQTTIGLQFLAGTTNSYSVNNDGAATVLTATIH